MKYDITRGNFKTQNDKIISITTGTLLLILKMFLFYDGIR